MSVETAVTGLMIATPKLARLLVSALFMVIHLFLLVVVLFLLRRFQLSPSQLQMWAASLLPSWLVSTSAGISDLHLPPA
jgi:hypothetical protein